MLAGPEAGIGIEKESGIVSEKFGRNGLVIFFTQVSSEVKAAGSNAAVNNETVVPDVVSGN